MLTFHISCTLLLYCILAEACTLQYFDTSTWGQAKIQVWGYDIHHVYTFRLRIFSYDHEYFLAFITFYLDIIDHCLPKERFNYSVLILCRNGRKGPKTLLLLDYSWMSCWSGWTYGPTCAKWRGIQGGKYKTTRSDREAFFPGEKTCTSIRNPPLLLHNRPSLRPSGRGGVPPSHLTSP